MSFEADLDLRKQLESPGPRGYRKFSQRNQRKHGRSQRKELDYEKNGQQSNFGRKLKEVVIIMSRGCID